MAWNDKLVIDGRRWCATFSCGGNRGRKLKHYLGPLLGDPNRNSGLNLVLTKRGNHRVYFCLSHNTHVQNICVNEQLEMFSTFKHTFSTQKDKVYVESSLAPLILTVTSSLWKVCWMKGVGFIIRTLSSVKLGLYLCMKRMYCVSKDHLLSHLGINLFFFSAQT